MTTSSLTEENRRIYRAVEEAFGGNAFLTDHPDEDAAGSLSLLTVKNRPTAGVNSYATVGLSVRSIGAAIGSIPLGVEIVGATSRDYPDFANILADCALRVIHGGARFHPGAVFKDMIPRYYPQVPMKHILFISPYGWERELLTLELPSRWVGWMMALPVSEAELKFYNETESGELQERLEKAGVDIYNLNRPSVV